MTFRDVFGPLAACGNCENTKKTCTFEWLRSQRMLQASTPKSHPIPMTKKRRMKRDRWQDISNNSREPWIKAPHHVAMSDLGVGVTLTSPNEQVGLPSADFPCETHFRNSSIPPFQQEIMWNEPLFEVRLPSNGSQEQRCAANAQESNSVHRSSILTAFPADLNEKAERPCLVIGPEPESESKADSGVIRMPHKRKRRGSSTASAVSHCSVELTHDLISSADTAFLGDSLLRIYCDSFETHLSCWLTEKTCPYSKNCDVSLPNNYGPDWSRIYHRVFKLDQSSSVRGRSLTLSEDRAASRALNLAIISFASQWAAPNVERRAKYPFHISNENGYNRRHRQTDSTEPLYNRSFQLAAWHQARNAVHRAAGIESFRVVLAHIVLSLTQSPRCGSEKGRHEAECEIDPSRLGEEMEAGVDNCEDLLSRLDLTLHDDDSPLYLERGLRLIHSLRSNVMMLGALDGRRRKRPRCWKHLQARGLEAADRATVDVLFWLGVMFDTLSSAMHKRSLVICLEDSDLPAIESIIHEGKPFPEPQPPSDTRAGGFREDLLCKDNRARKHGTAVRWPCSEVEAVSLLCKAAPIKVLLFRKLTQIQTLLARHGRCEQIEAAVHSALGVHEYWQNTFAPFLSDCIDHHYELPEQVQSWHVCLAVHWHLATLLLADLIEALDDSEAGFEWRRRERESIEFVSRFRERNCRSLSELARCACSQEDSLLSRAKRRDFAISQGALLSEPWLDVFTRAFAIGGAVLLELTMDLSGNDAVRDDGFERVEDCVRALRILGQRSDKALSAAKMISRELDIVRAGL